MVVVVASPFNDCVRSVFRSGRIVEALTIGLLRRLCQGAARKGAKAAARQRIVRGSSFLSVRYRTVRRNEIHAVCYPASEASTSIRLGLLWFVEEAWEMVLIFSFIRANEGGGKVFVVRRSEDALTDVRRKNMFVLST